MNDMNWKMHSKARAYHLFIVKMRKAYCLRQIIIAQQYMPYGYEVVFPQFPAGLEANEYLPSYIYVQ